MDLTFAFVLIGVLLIPFTEGKNDGVKWGPRCYDGEEWNAGDKMTIFTGLK